ncbi:peroxisome membrane protein [Hesseltinella vesiculosa]|uniref:Peroxisomal membrane protein PEX16 n=1 Tax=Hesseltinella vesiculosa TaxID=101127 RepID=A0A1X2G2Y6_9FUNG|nr:peroxisome membrane protein [Hesseltinella vesiculosa]
MDAFKAYDDFLLKNVAQISTIESALRSLSYILPGRFQDAELTSQAIYAGLNVMSLYHNSVLRRAANDYIAQKQGQGLEESPFNKYTRFWTSASAPHRTISSALSLLGYTQVLIEMIAIKKLSPSQHYQVVAVLEAIKALLRLTLFRLTKHRMLLYPTHLERDVDPSALDPQRHRHLQTPTYHWTGRRTGKEIPFIGTTIAMDKQQRSSSRFSDVNDYLMSRVLTAEKLRKPSQMVNIMSSLARFGEVASIFRPLIYVLALMVYGRKAWKPWFISLAIDLIANYAILRGYQAPDGRNMMMPLEKNEYHRRLRLLVLYVIKGAFYISITRPKLERFCNRLETKPVLKMGAGILRDYLPLWQNIYFYSSTS